MTDLAASVIEQLRNKMIVESPAMIRECLDLLSDEQVWWRPNASSNSVGNLVLHLCGATRHFWGLGVGGLAYRRDRDAEFAERGPVPKAELRRLLDETVAEAGRILDELAPARLLEVADRGGATLSVLATLSRMSHHWSFHTGQIVFAAKQLREGAVTDLMRRVMVK
jgi:uncharacterized damage-inducible protein DinB